MQRGVLIALGRPDGRIASLARAENATLLSAMQAAAIENLRCGPEIVSVGHNTWRGNPNAIRNHVVLPTKRRPFMCEFLEKAADGVRDSRGKRDPTSIMVQLSQGTVVPPEVFQLAAVAHTRCDCCAVNKATVECAQCASVFCHACSNMLHVGAHSKIRGHTPLGLHAALRMRLQARRARARVHARRGGGAAADDEDEHVDEQLEAASKRKRQPKFHLLGTEVGNSLPGFGVRAASLALHGHGMSLRLAGAPMGMHYARKIMTSISSDRARRRWKFATSAVVAERNPWKQLLLQLAGAGELGSHGGVFSKLNDIMSELDIHSQAVIASETPMKDLCEGRFDSLHRYIAFLVRAPRARTARVLPPPTAHQQSRRSRLHPPERGKPLARMTPKAASKTAFLSVVCIRLVSARDQVMFHAMALNVSYTSWPLPPFDISRSQSILRVASTAAPCSGAEVVHQLVRECCWVLLRCTAAACPNADEMVLSLRD